MVNPSRRQSGFDLFSSSWSNPESMNTTENETISTNAVEIPWRIATTAICSCGTISAILALCTVWRKLRTESSSFFVLMFLISSLDLLFNSSYIVFTWTDPERLAFMLSEGLAFSASLAADLCTLTLTAQRYAALKWPHWKLEDRRARVAVRAITAVTIAAISLTRFQYMFDESALIDYVPEWFVDVYKRRVYVYVETASNIVLPFVLLLLMAFFSVHIILVVKGRKQKVNHHDHFPPFPTTTTTNGAPRMLGSQLALVTRPRGESLAGVETTTGTIEQQRRLSVISTNNLAAAHFRSTTAYDPRRPRHSVVSTLSVVERVQLEQRMAKKKKDDSAVALVLFMDASFVLNQLGYCVYTIASIVRSIAPDDEAVERWQSASDVASDLIECLSRSLNFFFYLRFSKMMRDEFQAFVERIKKCSS